MVSYVMKDSVSKQAVLADLPASGKLLKQSLEARFTLALDHSLMKSFIYQPLS